MDTLAAIFTYFGGSVALLGGIAWIIKSALGHFATRDLESFKAGIANTASFELERLKAELKAVTSAQERRGTLLVEKRAEVVAEIYRRLVDFIAAAESFSSIIEYSGEPNKEEKAKKLGDAAGLYFSYYQYNKIYFSAGLCEKFKVLFDSIHAPTLRLRVWMNMKDSGGDSHMRYTEAWSDAWKAIQSEVPPILAGIEEEFRTLLGDAGE